MVAVGADDLEHVHRHMEGRWEALRRRDVLITGGTGFFGKWLLESWVSAQERFGLGGTAWVVSRDPEAFLRVMPHLRGQASLRFVRGDVQGLALPPEARFSHVIHAATQASAALNQDAPLQMLDTIVAGTRRVLELARERGAEAFLLTSSGAVYGRQPADLHHIPETFTGGPDPLDPGAAYGEGKRLAESLCAAFGRAHGLACKIARCFAFVGPHLPLDTHFAAGNFLRDGQAGGPIRVGGDGTPHRSYLYAADLTVWLWRVLLEGQPLRPYNVGSDESIDIADLARRVGRLYGCEVRIAKAPPPPGTPPARYVPATERARRELGLHAWTGLDEGLARTRRFIERAAAHASAGG